MYAKDVTEIPSVCTVDKPCVAVQTGSRSFTVAVRDGMAVTKTEETTICENLLWPSNCKCWTPSLRCTEPCRCGSDELCKSTERKDQETDLWDPDN